MTLRTCSRCQSEVLEEYFEIDSKGVRNKCCKLCIVKYQCDRCEYQSSTNGHLKRHVKQVHDKIKDVKCDQCDFACSTNGDLKRHVKICTGKLNCSAGEYYTMQALGNLGLVKDVDYFFDQSYIVKDKSWLKWDFRILYRGMTLFIEYDGKGHVIPIKWSRAITDEEAQCNLEEQQRKDKIKDDYCLEFGYPLLRIPHTEFDNIEKLVREFMGDFM